MKNNIKLNVIYSVEKSNTFLMLFLKVNYIIYKLINVVIITILIIKKSR